MGEWTTTTLGRLGRIFDGPHATPTRRDIGPYFLNIASLDNGRLDLSKSDHVSPEDFARWTRRVTPQEGDLLFSYETRLGDAALMPPDVDACLGRRMALLRPDRTVADPRFLLYLYLSPQMRLTIDTNAIHGATVDRIPLKTMSSWAVSIPTMATQRAIAEVLGALDDKIAANSVTIDTAGELAIALAGTAVESVTVQDVAEARRNSVSPALMAEQLVDHYSLPAFDDGRIPDRVAPESIKSSKFRLTAPAVLISKLNPRFPRVWDLEALPDVPALASTEYVVLEPRDVPTTVLWALLSQRSVTASIQGMVAGTSGSHQRVKPEAILATAIGDPASLDRGVVNQITALGRCIAHLRSETTSLGATRDALLPGLMSGKLRVRDAELQTEELT